jgi:hypothetical protein
MDKRYKDLHIGDTFPIEYGAYGNWTNAVVVGIERPYKDQPQYDYILEIEYTIPTYCGDKIFKDRFVETDRLGK